MMGEKILLRLFMRSGDLYHFGPAYERIVSEASRQRLAGVTVLRGILGFGARGTLRPSNLRLMGDAPVIVECIDTAAKINTFLNDISAKIFRHGTATLERAGVVLYRAKDAGRHDEIQLLGGITPLSTLPEIQGAIHMHTNSTGLLLRIFIGESDRYQKRPLHEAIVEKARELGLSGATVLRGSMGFGANSVLHTNKVLVMSSDLPIVIEIVDSRQQVEKLLPALDEMVRDGMITMEEVQVVAYRHDPESPPAAPGPGDNPRSL